MSLFYLEVQQVEEDKNEMYFSDKLITIEEANHRNENDFIFEKSLFESNELIDNIDISKPIDEQVKLKKLRSRKLRRRKKATKLKNQIKSNIIMKGINFIQRPTPIARGPPESHAKIPLNACGNWWWLWSVPSGFSAWCCSESVGDPLSPPEPLSCALLWS